MRKIPATMATQHPDHAAKPYWHPEAFIGNRHEAYECFLNFSELGITEFKWDWEGKLVDESVLERLFGDHFSFFKKNPLGQEKFLTFRLPNPKVETEFRLGRAFMNLASAASVAKHFGLPTPPLFEVILPMTQSASEILSIQEAFQEIHSLSHPLYKLENILTNLHVIPLFEAVNIIIDSSNILEEYITAFTKRFKKKPNYLRPYVARSDPALNSGLIPTVLAIKIALSRYKKLSEKLEIPFFPIIGAAALPFRGGISPNTITQFVDEYSGIRTTTIQSAFRYDFPKEDVIKSIATLERILPKNKIREVDKKDEKELISIIPFFEKFYKEEIEEIAPIINDIALFMPKRRERVQHVGLFGYSRGVGKVKLPRAISFTGALYSIGIPPEFIATGKVLSFAQKQNKLDLINKYYLYLKENLIFAGKYLNRDNLSILAKKSPVYTDILESLKNIEKIYKIEFTPTSKEEKEHKKITTKILKKYITNEGFGDLIEEAAILRKSLG